MAINKVVLNNETVLDLTNDTVSADKLAQGYTAHDKTGNAITGTMTGGSGGYVPTDAELTFSGGISGLFSRNRWNWVINNYGNRITTTSLESANNLFLLSTNLRQIPFDINLNKSTTAGSLFESCYSLRTLSESLLGKLHNDYITAYYNKVYCGLFVCCYALDEINGLAVDLAQIDTNVFSMTFVQCGRLKNIIFETTNGAAKTAEWANQVMTLSYNLGYLEKSDDITAHNSGITIDKRVTDATTYEALKDDPDWWTTDINYSRYNHDSAVATINSLPDTSAYLATAGGTNTIKFQGAAGSATDGGAINTLTEEEIAVAAAKGWSIAYV